MIEDTLARHYQAENLPDGHPVREAIDEIRRLRACNYESIAMYRRCRDERDALRAELNETNERRAETIAMCDQMRAERDALLADASRYRYLRNRNPDEVLTSRGLAAGLWIDCENSSGTLMLVTGDDADKGIDAAMEKEQSK